MTTELPDAEATLLALAERMRGAVAFDAAFVGIYSGGAWLAERLPALVPGQHPVGFIDVSFYRDDYATAGLKGGTRRTSLPFNVEPVIARSPSSWQLGSPRHPRSSGGLGSRPHRCSRTSPAWIRL